MATEITTWAELAAINSGLAGDYILMNNLDENSTGYSTYASETANSNSGWTPLGDSTTKFTGDFDGDDYTISDIYMICGSRDYNGLFGYTDNSTISNVGIVDIDISGGDDYTGGLVGYNNSSSITSSYSTGIIYGFDNYVGGLVGYNYSSSITNSYSTCTLTGNGGSNYVGGLVGQNNYSSSITNSYSTGNSTGTTGNVGGLVGQNSSSSITNSYSTGNSTGTTGNVGGLVGYNSSSSITSSYSTGNSTGGTTGGLIANYVSGAISNCFWDMTTSGQATSAGSETGKTTAQMKDYDTFNDASWEITEVADFNPVSPTIWYINDSYERPKLGWAYVGYEQLEGNVTFNSTDIEGAEIFVLRPTDNTIINRGTSDVNGDYSLGVEVGTYHVICQYDSGSTKYNAESLPYVVVS